MLDDAYAEEMRQKQASAGGDNSTGGGGGGGSSGTVGPGGAITVNNVQVAQYNGTNNTIFIANPNSGNYTLSLPLTVTDSGNGYVPNGSRTLSWGDIDWGSSGIGQADSYIITDSSGNTVSFGPTGGMQGPETFTLTTVNGTTTTYYKNNANDITNLQNALANLP